MPIENNPTVSKKMILLFVFIIGVLLLVVWFIFGWLYGPRPALNTVPKAISSYFNKNAGYEVAQSSELENAGGDLNFLKLPKGFKVSVFAENLGGPNIYTPGVNWGVRQMTLKDNVVYATLHKEGKVIALFDKDGDGRSDQQAVFLSNLSLPHGIETYKDWIYVAQNNSIIRAQDTNSDGIADSPPEKILDLPPLLEHWTKTVHIFPDPEDNNLNPEPKMFVSIGSSCNSCVEQNPLRAAMLKCNIDGTDCQVYAKGFRNMVDFTLYDDKIFGTDTGKDFLGNDIPPEEVNIVKQNKDYGWPQCYGKQVHDTSFDSSKDYCKDTEPSFTDLPAHSTAIGITGYSGNGFPKEYSQSLYVALHGSYQSDPASGYKVVRIDPDTGNAIDFITGFNENNDVRGRPVHILNYHGGLLVSDDQLGKIYLVQWVGDKS